MSTPTDALDLFRTVIACPNDETPRLVFADWLEDTGEPHNTAWAKYLRLNTFEQGRFLHCWERERLARRIRARLSVNSRLFLDHRETLLKLLPPTHITVRLDDFHPDSSLRWSLPQSVAIENVVVLLARDPEVAYFASRLRNNEKWYGELRDRLEFLFDCFAIVMNANEGEVRDCLRRVYPDPPMGVVPEYFAIFLDDEILIGPD